MKAIDRSDLWFGIVLVALFVLAALVFGPVFAGSASHPVFWVNFGIVLIIGLLREPISRLGSVPRFMAWFCLGVLAAALFTLAESRAFDPALAAGLALGLAILDILVEPIRSRRAAGA